MFSRTEAGIRNTPEFHRGSYIVIVEGESDCPFWKNFFPDQVNGYKCKLKPVGGFPEAQKYIDQIVSSNAKFIVAVDSDYRSLLGVPYRKSRVLETGYHSIENLMICSAAIADIIQNLSCNVEYELLLVDKWLNHFDESTHPLMVADLVVKNNDPSKECIGKNCSRFLIKKRSEFDSNQIEKFLQDLELPVEDFENMKQKVKHVLPRFHIRGHFFSSAAANFVRHEVKKVRKISIDDDSFYSMLVMLCKSRIEEDPVLRNIRERAWSAAQEVTTLLLESK